ncbi:FtsW/RodA/SpoVE family cell cycle protein [Clostridium sp. SHJSY1]|uniref:FtsW/RodA/SpoVE family cell cycle protein n=1 Tax=Clostridium sp. SHJSY1 TaxID=2942483 RepID=UPI0028745458|nr:FtsW/RodA/SpoVE family cell cycle protein [Clostridium sp. SHJSY1]MDS0526227.1 FtsW/RodA/SpoVE family cell cycle protein [Clostridium sp. SHJSY1]
MKIRKDEVKLLIITYIFCIVLFGKLAISASPMDTKALIIGGISCLIIGVAYFVVRKFYPDGDKFLLIFACILSIIGIAMIYRLNSKEAGKQVVYVGLGIAVYILTVMLLPRMEQLSKYKYIYLGITVVMMPLALIFGTEVNGSKNWVYVGGTGFQPSEFAKIALVLYLAAFLKDFNSEKKGIENVKQLIEPAGVMMFALGCLVLQKDLGSALIFFGVAVSILYVVTAKKKYVFASLGAFSVGSVLAYNLFSHVRLRVMIWKDPWKYASDQGYQIVQGLYSISSGGMFGSGLGQGSPNYVPVNTSDFIFAVICEEFGMVFGIGIMILMFLLFYRGIRVAFITENKFSQITAVGLSTMIACQTLVIIGGIFAIIPLTGITLPFVSYGGSSLLTTFFALGLLQKISEEG